MWREYIYLSAGDENPQTPPLPSFEDDGPGSDSPFVPPSSCRALQNLPKIHAHARGLTSEIQNPSSLNFWSRIPTFWMRPPRTCESPLRVNPEQCEKDCRGRRSRSRLVPAKARERPRNVAILADAGINSFFGHRQGPQDAGWRLGWPGMPLGQVHHCLVVPVSRGPFVVTARIPASALRQATGRRNDVCASSAKSATRKTRGGVVQTNPPPVSDLISSVGKSVVFLFSGWDDPKGGPPPVLHCRN